MLLHLVPFEYKSVKLFEAHLVFEGSIKCTVLTFFEEESMLNNNFLVASKTHCIVIRAIDRFGCKRYQMKRYLMGYKCFSHFASKYLVDGELQAFEYSFTTHVHIWSKVDAFFCYSVYLLKKAVKSSDAETR